MLRVDLTALDAGLHEMELTPTADDLDLDPEVFADIAVAVQLDVADRRIRANYATRATATLECDRTLAEYRQPVEASHEVLFTAASIDADAEDIYPLSESARELDLAEPVRDTLLLSLPLRRVAPEAEEIEIPTRFGGPTEDEPIDDRWAALRRLRDSAEDDDDSSDDS